MERKAKKKEKKEKKKKKKCKCKFSCLRDEAKVIMHSNDPISPVAYLKLLKYHLEEKKTSEENSEKSFASPKVFYLDSTSQQLPSDIAHGKEEGKMVLDGKRRKCLVVSAGEKRNQSLAEQITDIFLQTESKITKSC